MTNVELSVAHTKQQDRDDIRFIPGFRPMAPLEDVDRRPLEEQFTLVSGIQGQDQKGLTDSTRLLGL